MYCITEFVIFEKIEGSCGFHTDDIPVAYITPTSLLVGCTVLVHLAVWLPT